VLSNLNASLLHGFHIRVGRISGHLRCLTNIKVKAEGGGSVPYFRSPYKSRSLIIKRAPYKIQYKKAPRKRALGPSGSYFHRATLSIPLDKRIIKRNAAPAGCYSLIMARKLPASKPPHQAVYCVLLRLRIDGIFNLLGRLKFDVPN
jgi:hypothetical protein